MKNKKILFFSILVFVGGIFLANAWNVDAADCPPTESFCVGKSIGDSCTKDSKRGECSGRGCDEDSLFCNTVAADFPSDCPGEGFKKINGVCFPAGTGLSEKSVKEVIVAVLGWLLNIFGVLGILTFIVSGIFYLTAAGDAEQEKKAKNAMKMGIIGVVVALSGFVIIKAIDAILNARMGA